MAGSPAQGDLIRLQIRVDESGIIEEARFKTYGCGAAIASSSLATEWLRGKTLEQATAIGNMAIARELQLDPVKLHCSMLAEDAIAAAVRNYQEKHQG
jgi:nitrogen fixation NifU-like protein